MPKMKVVLESSLTRRQIPSRREHWKGKIKEDLRNRIKSKSYETRSGKVRYELYVIANIAKQALME